MYCDQKCTHYCYEHASEMSRQYAVLFWNHVPSMIRKKLELLLQHMVCGLRNCFLVLTHSAKRATSSGLDPV